MPIVHVGASKTVGDDIIPSSGNKAKASSTTPVRQTTVNQKEAKISKLSASSHRRSKQHASAKKKTSGKLQTTSKVMSDQEKKSIELKLKKQREKA